MATILYKVGNAKGEYSCGDIGVSTEEWLDLLHREKAQQYIDVLLCFLREPEQKGTCTEIGKKYGKLSKHINGKVTKFSEWVRDELDRFRVVDTDNKPTFWCIPMKKGWDSKHGFVWQLRDELSDALRAYLMEKLIDKYSSGSTFNGYEEQYKWKLLANTKGKSAVEIATSLIGQNIIDAERNGVVLKTLAESSTDALSQCVTHLFDESKPLDDRLAEYKSSMKDICAGKWGNCANDERTAASLLTCKYPEKYTFYKSEIYLLLCKYFGYESRKAGKKYSHFLEIINGFVSAYGEKIQSAMLAEIEKFEIKPLNLAVQTLFWCMRAYLKENMQRKVTRYWLVGYSYGSTDSQLDRFLEEGIWVGRFNDDSSSDQSQQKLAMNIQAGDVLILKSSSTKGENHDQPFIRVKGIGIAESDIEDIEIDNGTECKCDVKYINTDTKDFDGSVYGSYRKTIHQADSKVKSVIDYVNQVLNNYPPKLQPKYSEYIKLLKETYNLVLTGAPGTGKTYMAQAIAEEMGCTKDEMCFVQFHPSYDYTDFVEGLRPMEKSDGQMGFERRDGVFKEFCKRAVKNVVDSHKSIESLAKEMSWEEQLQQFIEDATENNTKFKLTNGSEFTIEEVKGRIIVVHNEQNEKITHLSVNVDMVIDILTNDVPLKKVADIRNYYHRKYHSQSDSYAFIIIKAIRGMKKHVVVASADKVERKPFVFIIDEINRGEASKIFGELFYAIDPGYRGKKDIRVTTQYQNLVPDTDAFANGFYVPENVYILATMNDIDRSVESMDFAMRRRFSWKEVAPADTQSMLDTLACADEAKKTMTRLNEAIAETDGLGAAYMVGPSYFLKLQDNGGDFTKLWKMNIEPLLKEYLRGFRKINEIMDKFSKAYFAVEEPVTDPEASDELV